MLENLKTKGHKVIPESARVLLDEGFAQGKTLQEIRADERAFQWKVLDRKVEVEEKLDPSELIFLDRGIPDSIAYYQIAGEDPAPALRESQKRRYRAVFLCEQVPFENDNARTEDQKKAEEISNLLFKAYTDLGYKVVRVPLMSVEERVQLVLQELGRPF